MHKTEGRDGQHTDDLPHVCIDPEQDKVEDVLVDKADEAEGLERRCRQIGQRDEVEILSEDKQDADTTQHGPVLPAERLIAENVVTDAEAPNQEDWD